MKKPGKKKAARGKKAGMNMGMMAGRSSQKMKPNPFFSSVSSVKPEPDMKPRPALTSRAKKRLATKPI